MKKWLDKGSLMFPADFRAYDGACVGRPATHVVHALDAYHHLEQVHSPRTLHRFHMQGFLDAEDSAHAGEHGMLRAWRGFRALEESIVGLVAVQEKTSWLVDYGKSTIELVRLLLEASGRTPALMTEDLYDPWKRQIFASCKRTALQLDTVKTRRAIAANEPDRVVEAVTEAILRRKPGIVFLSIVTQGGYRMPVENILEVIAGRWTSRYRLPLFVLDGCQVYGRAPFNIDEDACYGMKCAFVGCMHKAVQGPKEFGFLLCTSYLWQRRLINARNADSRGRDLFMYARTTGQHPELPTLDCAPAIGTAAALYGLNRKSLYEEWVAKLRLNQYELVQELRESDWHVVTPKEPQWATGIVLLRPPPWLCLRSRHGIKEILELQDRIFIDELHDDGLVRIAFDRSHPPGEGAALGRRLREIADELKRL